VVVGLIPASPDNASIQRTADAAANLVESSRRLEAYSATLVWWTRVLVGVTTVLAVATVALILRGSL
jgi:hypothetical protein